MRSYSLLAAYAGPGGASTGTSPPAPSLPSSRLHCVPSASWLFTKLRTRSVCSQSVLRAHRAVRPQYTLRGRECSRSCNQSCILLKLHVDRPSSSSAPPIHPSVPPSTASVVLANACVPSAGRPRPVNRGSMPDGAMGVGTHHAEGTNLGSQGGATRHLTTLDTDIYCHAHAPSGQQRRAAACPAAPCGAAQGQGRNTGYLGTPGARERRSLRAGAADNRARQIAASHGRPAQATHPAQRQWGPSWAAWLRTILRGARACSAKKNPRTCLSHSWLSTASSRDTFVPSNGTMLMR